MEWDIGLIEKIVNRYLESKPEGSGKDVVYSAEAIRSEEWILQDRMKARDSFSRISAPITLVSAVSLYFLAPTSVRNLTTLFFLMLFSIHTCWIVLSFYNKTPSLFRLSMFAAIESLAYLSGLGMIMINGALDQSMDISNRLIGWILYTFFGTLICNSNRGAPLFAIVGAILHVSLAMVIWIVAGHQQVLAMIILVTCTDGLTLMTSRKRIKDRNTLARLALDKAYLLQQNETLKRQAIESELLVASRIQSSLTVPAASVQVGRMSVSFHQEPYGILGGDWLATRKLEDGSLVIGVADVSGKGIPAAMVVQSLQTLWSESLHANEFLAGSWMSRVNNSLLNLGEKEAYTLTMGLVVLSEHKLVYYCAGHVPIYVIEGSGKTEKLSVIFGDSNLMGISRDFTVNPRQIDLQSDQSYRIFLGTDGVFDWTIRRNPKKLLKLVAQIQVEGSKALRSLPAPDDKILVVIESQEAGQEAA